jgi:hypothetical protein
VGFWSLWQQTQLACFFGPNYEKGLIKRPTNHFFIPTSKNTARTRANKISPHQSRRHERCSGATNGPSRTSNSKLLVGALQPSLYPYVCECVDSQKEAQLFLSFPVNGNGRGSVCPRFICHAMTVKQTTTIVRCYPTLAGERALRNYTGGGT